MQCVLCPLCLARREPLHAEAGEDTAEEAVPDSQGEGPSSRGTQQGHPGPQQAGEPVQGATEAQQDLEGRPTKKVTEAVQFKLNIESK